LAELIKDGGTRTSMANAIAEARVQFVCSGEPSASSEHLAEVVDSQEFRRTGAAGIEPATLSLEGSSRGNLIGTRRHEIRGEQRDIGTLVGLADPVVSDQGVRKMCEIGARL